MNKDFFLAITNRLSTLVPQLRWVDADEGQLSTSPRPSVAFPACLVDISYPQCETTSGGRQKVKAKVDLRIAFDMQGQTATAAPMCVRERALLRLDILQCVHEALQWWDAAGQFNPLKRISSTPERRADGIKVYRVVYETAFFD